MAEVVVVPSDTGTDVFLVQDLQTEILGLPPEPETAVYTVPQVEVAVVIDTGKGDTGAVGPQGPEGEAQPITWNRDGTVDVIVGKSRYPFLFDATLVQIAAVVGTAPVGAPGIVLDLNKNGLTVWPDQLDRLVIPPGSHQASAALSVPVSEGDYLTLDVDDTGSTLAGEDLTVVVRYQKV